MCRQTKEPYPNSSSCPIVNLFLFLTKALLFLSSPVLSRFLPICLSLFLRRLSKSHIIWWNIWSILFRNHYPACFVPYRSVCTSSSHTDPMFKVLNWFSKKYMLWILAIGKILFPPLALLKNRMSGRNRVFMRARLKFPNPAQRAVLT